MSFPTPAVYGMYPPSAALKDVVHTLNHAGFVNEDICMMLSPSHPIASLVRDAGLHDCDRQANSIAAKLIRSQAFFKALVSGEDAPGFCGQSTTLEGLGFNAGDAARFEKQLRGTGVLIYVACPEGAKRDSAIKLLRSTGAREAAMLECGQMAAAAVA